MRARNAAVAVALACSILLASAAQSKDEVAPAPAKPAAKFFALSFSRDGQCVLVQNSPALSITGALTMEAWVQADYGLQSHYYNYFLSKNMGDTGYGLRVKGDAGHKSLCGLAASVPFTAKPGEWTHIADVLDGTEERLYLNGILAGRAPYDKPLKVNDLPLWIGSSPFGADKNWRGAICEVRIWAVARTQDEIRATMYSHLHGDEPGLRACWPMDEGQGRNVADLTGHTPPGQLGAKAESDSDAPLWVPRIEFEPPQTSRTEAGANVAPLQKAGPRPSGIALLPAPEKFSGKVSLVRNGEVLLCGRPGGEDSTPVTLRLNGIACPVANQPYGKLARSFTERLALDQVVDVRIIGLDSKGNPVADVTLADGRELAHELLKAGLAWNDTVSPRSKEYAALEDAARAAKAGLWADEKPTPPWAFVAEAPKPPLSRYDELLKCVVIVRAGEFDGFSIGSGFFVSSTGLIVTNHHVVGDNRTVEVRTRDSRTLQGKVLRKDAARDLALIQVQGANFPYLHLQVATDADIGSDVLAIGDPIGFQWSMTKGIVSGFRNERGVADVQTDTAINPGNSGGPLILAQNGKVIGVNTWKLANKAISGLGFAVSTKEILAAFPELKLE